MQRVDRVQRFQSTDVAEVVGTWEQFAPSAKLLEVDPKRCRLEWTSASLPGLALIKYEMAAAVRSSVEPEDQLFSCLMTTASGGCEDAHGALDPRRPWATDGRLIRGSWDDTATVHAMVFDRRSAEILARQMSGDDTLTVRIKAPGAVSAAAATQWERAFGYVASSIVASEAELDAAPLLEAGLLRHALWAFLTAFPTTFSDALQRTAQTTAAPKTVRRALSYIDAHAHLPITVDDVARAAHISTRGLQHAFRRSVGFTPREYLRKARLAGARQEVLSASPEETVSAVARRWGYANTARFASYYREEFGVHPATDLRRGQ